MKENAGFVVVAAVCVGFTVVIIVLSIVLTVTCWHKVCNNINSIATVYIVLMIKLLKKTSTQNI